MSYNVRVKICGLTREADACQTAALGADAIGLNFTPSSPRHVDRPTAELILRTLPPLIDVVGVFTNQPLRDVYQVAGPLGLRTVQWHGDRHELAGTFPFRYIPAFAVGDEKGLLQVRRYLDLCRGLGQMPAALLIDGRVPGQYGGTGVTAPWHLLADFQPGLPLILAGGLTPDNVAEAVRIVRPYAVDVASGVESGPGVKDAEKVKRFIASAREAAARLA